MIVLELVLIFDIVKFIIYFKQKALIVVALRHGRPGFTAPIPVSVKSAPGTRVDLRSTLTCLLFVCVCVVLGPERGMREAADARVRLGAAEPHTERSVPATCQDVHESRLPGRNARGRKREVAALRGTLNFT